MPSTSSRRRGLRREPRAGHRPALAAIAGPQLGFENVAKVGGLLPGQLVVDLLLQGHGHYGDILDVDTHLLAELGEAHPASRGHARPLLSVPETMHTARDLLLRLHQEPG